MRLRTLFASLAILALGSTLAYAAVSFQVRPGEFDPGRTFLVQAEWLDGIGCPTSAKTTNPPGSYTDPACLTGDSNDQRNQGLLLAKTGPTANNASAFARLDGVKGITVTELGYDIRKPGVADDPRGSHCGAGAPRFNVETKTAFYFIGCNSPPATTFVTGAGWLRLRWGGTTALMGYNASTGVLENVVGEVKSISIVFDEGQDTGPDNFGLAVIDNIDVNGTLVGRGTNQGGGGNNEGKDNDKGDDHGDRD